MGDCVRYWLYSKILLVGNRCRKNPILTAELRETGCVLFLRLLCEYISDIQSVWKYNDFFWNDIVIEYYLYLRRFKNKLFSWVC